MADFGNAGTITVKSANEAATLVDSTAGEYLFYRLTVSGANPRFTFTCDSNKFSHGDFPGDPKSVYEWSWNRAAPLAPGAPNAVTGAPNDTHVTFLDFITATKYSLFIEQRRADDTRVKVLRDVDYASQDSNDTFGDMLDVLIK